MIRQATVSRPLAPGLGGGMGQEAAGESGAADGVAVLLSRAEDGEPEPMFLLGIAYAQGQGVERNDTAAARWFQQAARKGHLRARTSIGYLYAMGRGVRQDALLGFLFLRQAMDQGDPLAADLLAKLRRGMTPAQLAEAEKRASEAS